MKKKEVLEIISDKLYENLLDYEIRDIAVCTNIRNNGVSIMGLRIRLDGKNIAPCVYADRFLPNPNEKEEYDESLIDFDDLARKIAEEFRYAVENFAPDDKGLYEIEDVREKIILALVNYQKNQETLQDCPYILFHDLAITFRVFVSCGKRLGSFLVTNRMTEYWGLSTKEIWKLAIANTMRLFPPVIEKLDDVMKHMVKENSLSEVFPDSPFYLITNNRGMFGASVILYDDIFERLSSILNENFYILPSSVNELLAVPESLCPDTEILQDMVRDVNDHFVEESEILSFSVYFYDKKEDCIRVITA